MSTNLGQLSSKLLDSVENEASLVSLLRKAIRLADLTGEKEYRLLFEMHLSGYDVSLKGRAVGIRGWKKGDVAKWQFGEAFMHDRSDQEGGVSTLSVAEIESALEMIEETIEPRISELSGPEVTQALLRKNEFNRILSNIRNRIAVFAAEINDRTDEIEPGRSEVSEVSQSASTENAGRQVFVVHGHNQGTKEGVARFLEKVDLEPVILHEKPNKGQTIIEKFERHSSVGFAVVLLTADDEGSAATATAVRKPRARQNVVFELGFFCGCLGRSRVCALYEEEVEIPTDYAGVLYISLNEDWRPQLAKELKAAGLPINAEALL